MVAADTVYKTLHIAKDVTDLEILPVLLYSRPRTPKGYLKKNDFVFDEHYDYYICPKGQVHPYRTTTRDGYRQYASHPKQCLDCPLLSMCAKPESHETNSPACIGRVSR